MAETDKFFRDLYNDHPSYVDIRNRTGIVWQKYTDDVNFWKLKYLEKLVINNNILKSINKVAEIGCATGYLLNNFFTNNNYQKTGIDISTENIKFAKIAYPHISFFEGTLTQYLGKNTELISDVTLLSDVLEHVMEDVSLLNEAGTHSKFVLLNLPIEKVPEYKDRVYGRDDIEGHLRAYSLSDALDLCKKADMDVIEYFNLRYVQEPIFRKYLFNKKLSSFDNKLDSFISYQEEIIAIDLSPEYYKSNFFALLRHKKNE